MLSRVEKSSHHAAIIADLIAFLILPESNETMFQFLFFTLKIAIINKN
jgi:hypothetical protein